jgi:hypothetical protein
MFDGFFTRIRTIMGLGAAHGKRGFPREEHGIAIPVWGQAVAFDGRQSGAVGQSSSANVTPITSAGANTNG